MKGSGKAQKVKLNFRLLCRIYDNDSLLRVTSTDEWEPDKGNCSEKLIKIQPFFQGQLAGRDCEVLEVHTRLGKEIAPDK